MENVVDMRDQDMNVRTSPLTHAVALYLNCNISQDLESLESLDKDLK